MTGAGDGEPGNGLTAGQQSAVEEFRRLRGVDPFGPFVPMLDSPELLLRVGALGEFLRYRSALPPRLSELAILVTAAHWQQSFEWEVHAPIALEAGIPQDAIDALWSGVMPVNFEPDQKALYQLCTELHRDRRVAAATYERARLTLGAQGAMDAIGICGYYALLAMVLNTRPPTR